MLSVASVRSAGGAANYFAKDDYYVGEHASEISGWGGRGAAELGLSGEVEKQVFEDLLKGKLPDGEQVGDPERRRAGTANGDSSNVSTYRHRAGDGNAGAKASPLDAPPQPSAGLA